MDLDIDIQIKTKHIKCITLYYCIIIIVHLYMYIYIYIYMCVCVYICICNMLLMVTVKVPSPSRLFFSSLVNLGHHEDQASLIGVWGDLLSQGVVRNRRDPWAKKPPSSVDFPSKVHGNHDETHGKPVDLHVSTPSPNYWGSPLAAIPEKIMKEIPSPPTIRIDLGGLGLVFMGVQQNPIDGSPFRISDPEAGTCLWERRGCKNTRTMRRYSLATWTMVGCIRPWLPVLRWSQLDQLKNFWTSTDHRLEQLAKLLLTFIHQNPCIWVNYNIFTTLN